VIKLIETILFVAVSFAVGLSGALVPGPMLTVTISDSMKKGFIAGPEVVLGHVIAEIVLMIVVLVGLGWLIGSQTASIIIGTVGGAILVFMGYFILRSSNHSINIPDDVSGKHGSVLNGIITSISNPYFFIWWATVGCAFMYKGLELAGIFGLLGFLIGHWSADLSWYSTVSLFSSKGSKLMSERTYGVVMKICGVFLVILGVYFVLSSQMMI
jgi:threonine/homoserine/homoserine lactone efflux protein